MIYPIILTCLNDLNSSVYKSLNKACYKYISYRESMPLQCMLVCRTYYRGAGMSQILLGTSLCGDVFYPPDWIRIIYLQKIGWDWGLPRPYMFRHPFTLVVAKFSTSAYGNYAALSAWGSHLFYHERQACRG